MKTLICNFFSVFKRFRMATLLNVAGLAVAFSAFLVIMMQVDYERSFDRCHPTAERVVRVDRMQQAGDIFGSILPRAFANAVFQSSPHIEAGTLVSIDKRNVYLTIGEGSERKGFREPFSGCYPEIVRVFGFDMLEGDPACLEEPEKAIIPESMARRMFGDVSAVGRQIHMEGRKHLKGDIQNLTVGGVYKDFPANTQLMNSIYTRMDKTMEDDWYSQNFIGYALLDSPGARQDVEDNFNNTFDYKARGYEENMHLSLVPLTEIYYKTGQLTDFIKCGDPHTVELLLLIALLVVVIAGINFTNFSTSLAPLRMKSINTQKVLGSSSGELRLALVGEAVCITLVGCLCAFLLVYVLNKSNWLSFIEADMLLANHLLLLAELVGMAVLVGVVAGLYPAWYMTSFSPALVLKGSFGLSVKGRKLRTALIGFQYVVSIGLIVGAMFVQLQNNYMRSFNLGFDKEQIAIVELPDHIVKTNKDVYVNKLKEYSGIEDVAFASSYVGGSDSYSMGPMMYDDNEFYTYIIPVSWNFLRVMGMKITEGRDFMESDARRDSVDTYIYNQSARERMQMEVGHNLTGNGNGVIAGFVGDVKVVSFRQDGPAQDVAFVVNDWKHPVSYIQLKPGTSVEEAVGHIRRVLLEMDSAYPFDIKFYDSIFDNLYQKEQYMKKMITLFGLLAIIISIVGVFGLVVFETQYRRKEIGIRKVHGATVGEILSMFNLIYLRIVCVCFLIGAPIAWYGVYKWLEQFSSRTPIYWWTFAIAFLIVAAVTLLTVTFQNWRAANENPVRSLRSE